MRKIIFSMNVSIDGFFEGPHKEIDWSIADEELHDFYTSLIQEADSMIFGRLMYETMFPYWPNARSDPHATPFEIRFAEAISPIRKIVYSTTLKDPGWNTQVIRVFDPAEIQAIKEQPGSYILLSGGARLAKAFFEHGLVDEYQLMIHPVAIGSGTPVFGNLNSLPTLEFVSSQRLASGAIALTYRSNGKK